MSNIERTTMQTDPIHPESANSPVIRDATFVTPEHCLSGEPGGQQQYTRELLDTLSEGGIRTHAIPLPFARALSTRLIRKLLNRPYRYSFAPEVVAVIAEHTARTGSDFVFLNGTTFFGIAQALRQTLPDKKLIMLSHGLESTDYVHALSAKDCDGGNARILNREVMRLGHQLLAERQTLHAFDTTVALSQVDAEINRWLGATHSIWTPRAVSSRPIEWAPVKNRVGLVGTLDHPPNYEGLHRILRVIDEKGSSLNLRLVGGPERLGQEFQARYRSVEYLGPLKEGELEREAGSWRAFLHPIFCFARGASTKLATGLGWGIPIVATTAGRRGYEWKSGRMIEANSPQCFVDETLRLASDDCYMMEARRQTLQIASTSPTISDNAQFLRQHLDSIHPRTS